MDGDKNASIRVMQDDEVALNIDINYVVPTTSRKDDEYLKYNSTDHDAVPFNMPSTGKCQTYLTYKGTKEQIVEDVSKKFFSNLNSRLFTKNLEYFL